jgi:RimJ/RimL family protein N-acetyltransferase
MLFCVKNSKKDFFMPLDFSNLIMPIRTPRLTIMSPAPHMGPAVYDAVMETQPQLREWLAWALGDPTPEGYEKIMTEAHEKFISGKDFMMLAFDANGKFVIGTGIHAINNFDTAIAHIGYWCRASEQGKGYVTEVANALTRYALLEMKLKKISIHAAVENTTSIAVAERLGFPLEYNSQFGTFRANTGEPMTLNVYSRFDLAGLPPLDVSWG